jgi:nucleotide-binding universal stress UspA family protein
MKTILALTDFSNNSTNAANAAVLLAGKIHANVLLYNNYETVAVASTFSGGPYVNEEFYLLTTETKRKLDHQLNQLQYIADDIDKDQRKPTLKGLSGDGGLVDNLKQVISENQIEFITMGAPSGTSIEHLFFGSETNKIIRHAQRPVLVVPANRTLTDIEKVVFATTFDELDIHALHYLIGLGKTFKFSIEVVHVNQPVPDEKQQIEKETAFQKHIARFGYDKISFKNLGGHEVADRLYRHCAEVKPDILAVVHHQHSFFRSYFEHSITKETLADLKLPLMIFPASM